MIDDDYADDLRGWYDEDDGIVINVCDVKVTTLATVKPERVEWLWKGRLPRGKLVVFDGDPELGKSTLALTFAAVITTGGTWPDGSRCGYCGDVVIMSAEDGLADTVRPRLDAAGADSAKVHALEAALVVDENGEQVEHAITLADVDRLKRVIQYYAAKLVIVDVLMAYLPDNRDSHRDQDIRSIFAPLSRIAADTACSILVLRHLNKGKGGNPLYRGGGSIAIVGAARVGLLAAKCPDDDDETLCAFAVQKNNLSAKPQTLTYRIVDCTNGAGKVEWIGTTDKPIHELLNPDQDSEVESWLREYLEAKGGSVNAGDAIEDSKHAGFTEDQVKKARASIGARSKRVGFGPGSTVIWSIGAHRSRVKTPTSMGTNASTDGNNRPPICPGCGTYYNVHGRHRGDCTANTTKGKPQP